MIGRDELKQLNQKLEIENSILIKETIHQKALLRNVNLSNRHTVAASEAKHESNEKEVKRLVKVLEKNDKYILDLEQKIRDKSLKIVSLITDKQIDQNASSKKNQIKSNYNFISDAISDLFLILFIMIIFIIFFNFIKK